MLAPWQNGQPVPQHSKAQSLTASTIWPSPEKLAKWVATTAASPGHRPEYWPNGPPSPDGPRWEGFTFQFAAGVAALPARLAPPARHHPGAPPPQTRCLQFRA